MSETSEHTPGPWAFECTATNGITIYADHGKRENPTIAELIADGPITPEMEANALVLATSPDLLEALIIASRAYCGSNENRDHIRAIIAKATGATVEDL